MDILIYTISRVITIGCLYKSDPLLGIGAVSYILHEVYTSLNRYYSYKATVDQLLSTYKKNVKGKDVIVQLKKDVKDDKSIEGDK